MTEPSAAPATAPCPARGAAQGSAPDPIAANLARWNARAAIHLADRTGFYDVAGVLAGTRGLEGVDEAELGPLAGLRIAHLQCHFGLDSLILARMGARVEGLDFSPVAVEAARALADRAGLPARFHLGDVQRAAEVLGPGRFDMVFATFGTICWLPDIGAWGAQAAALLKPGGRLFFRDSHPQAQALDPQDGRLVPCFDWRTPREAPLRFDEAQTYTGDAEPLPPVGDHEWIHPVSDIVMSLIGAGLRLDAIEEGDSLVWDMWPGLTRQDPDGLWRLPPEHVRVPLCLTIRASRPA